MTQNFNRSNINVPNFRQKTINHLKNLLNLIECTSKQKEFIWLKSIKILDEFILRAERDEFTIQRYANPSNIAATIVYTVIIANKNMPKISASKLERKLRLMKGLPPKKTYHEISRLYNKYFEQLYSRIEFRFDSGFKTIKNIVSLYFFELIRNTEKKFKALELVLLLKKNVLKFNTTSFPEGMTQERIAILNKMAYQYENEFNKYFSDLVNVIRGIIAYSKIPKKIGAHFFVKHLVDDLYKRNIDLLHAFTNFYKSVTDIYHFLKIKFPNDLPIMSNRPLSERYEKQEYVNIVGHRLKLYTIEHIYDGLYFIDGRGRCPKCYEEGLSINTDSVRSTSLEYHHETKEKESEYSAIKIFQMYQKSRSDPQFLEKLIKKMESDKVILLCRVHHQIKHSKYYKYFRHLINWKDIFSIPAQLIHILIRISVNYYHKTKNSSKEKKRSARDSIISFLRKRYNFEQIYEEKCPTCREFNIKEHLPGFDFNHIDEHHFHENPYILESQRSYIHSAAHLYYKDYTCSEIAKALEFENGGYICKNCHKVMDYSSIHLQLLEEIYDKAHMKEITNDYNLVKKRFKLYRYKESIGDPLKKDREGNESYERYLDAIYKLSHQGQEITHKSLADYLSIKRHAVFQYLKNNKSFFRDFIEVNIGIGHGHDPTEIFLTEQGKQYIELMYYIRDYYKIL